MILFIDNFDSFSHNLTDYLEQAGAACKIIRNDIVPDSDTFSGINGVVISPGPGRPEEAGKLMDYLKIIPSSTPVLGICLGHQAMGLQYGGKLGKALKPMHGKVSLINLKPHFLFEGLPSKMNVTRYHSLILEQIPESFDEIAFTNENENMAMAHKKMPYTSVQFHPEAFLTEFGLRIIKNWVDFNKIVI